MVSSLEGNISAMMSGGPWAALQPHKLLGRMCPRAGPGHPFTDSFGGEEGAAAWTLCSQQARLLLALLPFI